MKPVKVEFNGVIVECPYFLEIDFMVEDLLQKHKKSIISQFFERKVYKPDPTKAGGYNIAYENEEFNKKIKDMFLDVVLNNFIVSESTRLIKPWIYLQNKEYQHCEVHNHIGPTPASIAATCYTDIPDNGGDFMFYFGNAFTKFYKIKPKKNKLYLFPGWMFHSPTPQEDDKTRICVNLEYCCDMRPKVKGRESIIW